MLLLLALLWQYLSLTVEQYYTESQKQEYKMSKACYASPPPPHPVSSERCQHCVIIVFAANAMVSYSLTHIFPMAMSHFKLLGLDKSGFLGFKEFKTLINFFFLLSCLCFELEEPDSGRNKTRELVYCTDIKDLL